MTESTTNLTNKELSLLDRFYQQIILKSNKTHVTVPTPETKILNKKTFVLNFKNIIQKLNREEFLFVDFLRKEIGSDISVSDKGIMIICNIIRQPMIESLIKKFITTFVQCPQCKQLATNLVKKNGKTTLECKNCKATCTINSFF
jgi:translation initiation factor 2 subunit 2